MNEQQKKRISTSLTAALVTSAILPAVTSAQTTPYVVQQGDNLYRLAIAYNTTVNEIVAANNIANKHLIYVNQQLSIPTNTLTSTGSSGSSSSSNSSSGSYYYVLKGDTLSTIGKKFNVTVEQLAAWNGISDVNFIREGSLLRVGSSSSSSGGTSSGSTGTGSTTVTGGTYQVQKNDNLTKIAAKFGTTVWELAAWNNISNIHFIREGAYLIVTAQGASSNNNNNSSNNSSTGDVVLAANQYRVQAGDNLYRLAINFGTTVSQLAAWNNISNVRLIHVGDILQVAPSGTSLQSTLGATTPDAVVTPEVDVAPEVATTPEVNVAPEVVTTPEVDVAPEVSATPEVDVAPEVAATPEVDVAPEVSTTPEVDVAPEVATTPEVDVTPEFTEEDLVEVEEEFVEESVPVEDGSMEEEIIEVDSTYVGVFPSLAGTTTDTADKYDYTEPEEVVEEVQSAPEAQEAVALSAVAEPAVSLTQFRVPEETSVYHLSALFNVSVGELLSWNAVPNPQVIPAGTVLQVVAN